MTPHYSPRDVRLVVAFLAGAVAVEFFHRQLLAIAIEPVRAEFGLSDTEVGLLLSAFAGAYFLAALGLGRPADGGSRRGIYALCIGLWSAATAAGGAVGGFGWFLLTRIGVGAGQAGAGVCNAPLVADYVPPERRATALGLIAMGATIGTFLGLAFGGMGVAEFGWRATFAVGGLAGLLFAAAFQWRVDEPPRGWSEGRTEESAERPDLATTIKTLAGLRTFRHTILGGVLGAMGIMAGAQWAPAFFQRAHGFSVAQSGMAAGGIAILGTLGAVLGGVVADRSWRRNPQLALRLPALAAIAACPFGIAGYLWPEPIGAIVFISLAIILALFHAAPIGSVTQALAPLRMRGMAAGILNAVLTLTGMGLGPLLTGLLSDYLGVGDGNAEGLGQAMALGSILFLWGGFHLLLASRTLRQELAVTPQDDD
jgi:predicted MFS family arabinose efflux permease